MSELIAIIGPPGSGKSTSLRTLDPKETFIFNVANKPLPIKGYKKNYTPWSAKTGGNMYSTPSGPNIIKVLTHISKDRPEIKQVVIDDSNYIMAFDNMARAKEVGYGKFVEMAKNFFEVVTAGSTLRDDLKIFFFAHDEDSGTDMYPKRKFKTVGKLLDNAINIEGLFTYVLFTHVEFDEDTQRGTYSFVTNNDGTTTAKTPMDCFADRLVPNDLQFVVDKINEYNEG